MKFIIAILFISIFLFFIVFRYVMSYKATHTSLPAINFKTLQPPNTPNYYLVCPKDLCLNKRHATAPSFEASLTCLKQAWENVMQKQPRLYQVHQSPKLNQEIYIQLTRFWHFPDTVYIQFLPIDDTHSTLAIYSHANFGYSDFGVNQARVKAWIMTLEQEMAKLQSARNC